MSERVLSSSLNTDGEDFVLSHLALTPPLPVDWAASSSGFLPGLVGGQDELGNT